MIHPNYRSDIDGLRGIAVFFVVAFHAFPFIFSGGFIGVDIFFVISGFLISTIIFSNLENETFEFIEFYSRRIKRIFPALILVLTTSYTIGWFLLLADEYKQLGKHMAGGVGFISNFLLMEEIGYFDKTAETKPLLHLWSLGIEEQFYIFWPLLLYFTHKHRLNLLPIISSVAIVSFLLNIGMVHIDTGAAFYSPQTRAWELLFGSMTAYFLIYKNKLSIEINQIISFQAKPIAYMQATNNIKNIQSLLGIALITASILILDKEKIFPGWWALMPVLGTVLIILAGPQAWLNRAVLSNPILIWLGLISFPLYLWHWPLLSLAHIFESEALSNEYRLAVIGLSIVLAWLTYRLIEKPFKSKNKHSSKTIFLLLFMLFIGLTGYFTFQKNGLEFRLNDRQEFHNFFENSLPEWKFFKENKISEKYREECNFYDLEKYRIGKATKIPLREINKNCYRRNAEYAKTLFIWGDSHAQQLYYGLKNNLPPDWQILQVASSGCAPNINIKFSSDKDYCAQSNWFALKSINDTQPDVVIISQNADHNAENFKKIAVKLKSLGIKKIIFTGPVPHWTADLPKIFLTKLWRNTPQRTSKYLDKEIISNNLIIQKEFKSKKTEIFVNLIDFFCNSDGCMTYIGNDKKIGITSWDYGHLSPIASDFLGKNLLADLITEKSESDSN